MKRYLDTNRSLWDGWTPIHARSAFYDVDSFRKGASALREIELAQVGDVQDRTLLHLQCHFGLDTLSWARRGARVTGVDFSDEAIALARALAQETGTPARFLCENVYAIPEVLQERFDIVYTSYGVLPWLPDLTAWAGLVADALNPGGTFHIVEFHPLAGMLDDDARTFRYPYFEGVAPERAEVRGSYADPDADFTHVSYEWPHSLAEVFGALIGAGLTIESFHEYPYSPYNCFPFLEERESGRWFARTGGPDVPMVFSIRARAPGAGGTVRAGNAENGPGSGSERN